MVRVGDTVRRPLQPGSDRIHLFRDMIPVAIIDWDRTHPGTRLHNFADFLWAFVHPGVYGDGEPAARMLRVAVGAYGWSGPGLVDAMLTIVRDFATGFEDNPGALYRALEELAYLERNADLFRSSLAT